MCAIALTITAAAAADVAAAVAAARTHIVRECCVRVSMINIWRAMQRIVCDYSSVRTVAVARTRVARRKLQCTNEKCA